MKAAEMGRTDTRGRRGAVRTGGSGRLAGTAVLMAAVVALVGCSGDEGGSGSSDSAQDRSDAAAAKQASDARVSITPENGQDNVGIMDAVKVAAKGGKLVDVSLVTAEGGTEVEGSIAGDGRSWKPDSKLELSTKYKLSATASDSEGRKETRHSTFTTLSPENSFIGFFTPEDGSTVGVGMPVSINFNKAIVNKKDVQKGITVTSSSGQEVVGHWFNDTRLDFRPQEYWRAGSKVTLGLRLQGVEGSKGVYGLQSKEVTFTIGRSQVSTVDVNAKKMTVVRDGKTLKTIPISAGSPDNPTYNGAMVISEKHKETRMNGATVGFKKKNGKGEYDIPDVPHAMRLSTSGTFIHGNYWGKGVFGRVNTSHGCVGLQDVKGADDKGTPGAWFFQNSMIGDVVKVVNSPDKTITPDNGLNGWNMPWSQWKAGSAL